MNFYVYIMKLVKLLVLEIVNNFYKKSKPYSVCLLLLTFLFTVFLSFSYLDAKAASKPKLQSCQINSILTDFNDSCLTVKLLALEQLAEYDRQDLQSVVEEREHLKTNTVNIPEGKSAFNLAPDKSPRHILDPCNARCSTKNVLEPSKIKECVKCCEEHGGNLCTDQ